MWRRQARVRDLDTQLVVFRDPVEIFLEGQGLQRASQHRGADRKVAALEPADRGPGHKHPGRHLRLAHPTAAAGRPEPCSKCLSASLRVWMERLLGSAHDTYY